MGFEVAVSFVREEASKWDRTADRMEKIEKDIDGAILGPLAFMIADPVSLAVFGLSDFGAVLDQFSYNELRTHMNTIFAGADEESRQMATALRKIADKYEEMEEVNTINLNDVFVV